MFQWSAFQILIAVYHWVSSNNPYVLWARVIPIYFTVKQHGLGGGGVLFREATLINNEKPNEKCTDLEKGSSVIAMGYTLQQRAHHIAEILSHKKNGPFFVLL